MAIHKKTYPFKIKTPKAPKFTPSKGMKSKSSLPKKFRNPYLK